MSLLAFHDVVAVYHCNAWKDFVIEKIVPNAVVIPAHPRDSINSVLDRLSPNPCAMVLHLDVTDDSAFLPNREQLKARLIKQDIVLVNASKRDISKRRIQSTCSQIGLPFTLATPTGRSDELVIVKTNLNCGGEPEQRLPADIRSLLGIAKSNHRQYGSQSYAVLMRREVERRAWRSKNVCIERFITNKAGRFYRSYRFGYHTVVSESSCSAIIKKMGYGLPRRNYYFEGDTPTGKARGESILDIVRQTEKLSLALKIDFCAVDFVESDEGVRYACDINPTPYWGERNPAIISWLRDGLKMMIDGINTGI